MTDHEEVEEIVKIPYERIAVLIGKGHETIKRIEREAKVKLSIKRDENAIVIRGKPEHVYFAKDVIKAIGRGFNPDIALLLLKDDYMLEIIDLGEYYNTENAIRRIRGRIIGKKGTARKEIERMTDSYIEVYGNTVSIIAPYYTMQYAREAVEKLIRGAKHSTTFNYLSRAREKIFFDKLKGHKIHE